MWDYVIPNMSGNVSATDPAAIIAQQLRDAYTAPFIHMLEIPSVSVKVH